MKKVILSLAAALMLVGMAACGSDNGPLTESSAKSALKKDAYFAKDSQVAPFKVGFQEVEESYLDKLARLKAAGVIDYTSESVVETVTRRVWGGYWSGYSTVTREITHTFADVQLTEAGKKLVVENPTKNRADIVADFKANENYVEIMPEYMSALYGDQAVEEVAVEEVTEVDSVAVVDTVAVPEVVEEVLMEAPVNNGPNAAYEVLLARVNAEDVNVLLGRYEIVKVKEVRCTDDMLKNGKASCTVLYKFVDKTPFGYVFDGPKANYILSAKVDFILYQDMGWVVD